jgi:hypothetical protein
LQSRIARTDELRILFSKSLYSGERQHNLATALSTTYEVSHGIENILKKEEAT